MRTFETAYAVIRVETTTEQSDTDNVGPNINVGGYSITVKEVVATVEEAQAEVARLNALNEEIGCRYFWQSTHVFREGSHGSGERDTGA